MAFLLLCRLESVAMIFVVGAEGAAEEAVDGIASGLWEEAVAGGATGLFPSVVAVVQPHARRSKTALCRQDAIVHIYDMHVVSVSDLRCHKLKVLKRF